MKDLDELVTLWADDPDALSAEERARVVAHLAHAPGARASIDETRALLEQLRGLRGAPPPGELARDILRAVDAEEARAARSPWRCLRRTWRPALGLALAGAAAAIVIVARHDEPPAHTARVIDAGVPVVPPAPAPTQAPAPDAPLALGVEGEIDADALDAEVVDEVVLALGGDEWDAPTPEEGLVPDLSLDWVDDLDDAQVDAVDRWLAAR